MIVGYTRDLFAIDDISQDEPQQFKVGLVG